MCYSAESSLNSFIIGTVASLYLLTSKSKVNKHLGLFFVTVCLMQLLEYFMWIDQDCGNLNSFASKMVYVVLPLQTVAIILGGYLFNTLIINKEILYYLSIIYMLIIGGEIYNIFIIDKNKWCSKKNNLNNLVWDKFDKIGSLLKIIYYGIFLITPFLLSKEKWKGFVSLVIGVTIWLYSKYDEKNRGSSESRWCYFAAYAPVFFSVLDQFQF